MAKSVLLVDDDKVLNFLTAKSFKKSGLVQKIEVAYNGREALNYLLHATEIPDFILLDIGMPVMNGFEFLDEYCKLDLKKRPKIAIYTGSIEEADQEKAKSYEDIVEFIIKPLTPQNLDRIAELI